jgi:hypothetical protein
MASLFRGLMHVKRAVQKHARSAPNDIFGEGVLP